MEIKKIVITGGPCAGKSEAVHRVNETFSAMGYKVIVIPEGASELMINGITYESCGSIDEFERVLMKHQLKQENEAEKKARESSADKVIILCDRGAVDCRPYMTEEAYQEALLENGTSAVRLRDSYDAVFFLESVAKGAPERYVREGMRLENAAEAAIANDRLLGCWVGAVHLRIIDYRQDLEKKISELCDEIAFFLGEPEPLEIERKYLIEYPDMAQLLEDPFCHKVEITQTYINDPDGGFRIRKRGEGNDCLYFLTHKQRISDLKRIEIENRISKEEYQSLLAGADKDAASVSKDRYCMVYGNKYFEVDIFPFWIDRALIEIELKREDEEFILPPQFRIIREVTSDRQYTNKYIAKHFGGLSTNEENN